MKERAKLQRGKQCQGSSEEEDEEEEEEEEEGDGSGSPIPWDDLAGEDEDPPSPQVRPFLWHLLVQEREDSPLETVGASCLAPLGPSTVPLEPRGAGDSASSKPHKQRDGSKWQHDEESQLGSGGPAPKHQRPMASRKAENFLSFFLTNF